MYFLALVFKKKRKTGKLLTSNKRNIAHPIHLINFQKKKTKKKITKKKIKQKLCTRILVD